MYVTHLAVPGSKEYGLGNQLFQLAGTIGIARDNEREAKFAYWDNSKHFKIDLNGFIRDGRDLKWPVTHVKETSFDYNPVSLPNKDSAYILEGYFQSYKYFDRHQDYIRQQFTLTEEAMQAPRQTFSSVTLQGKRLCSISVRRGDYVNYPTIHPLQPDNYWTQAQDAVEERASVDTYLVFSDDPVWCRKNLHLFTTKNRKAFVVQGRHQIDDFVMITLCDHNIITNSTFSWWAAWLNPNPGKVVVMPKLWFGPTGPWSGPSNANDLRVPGWISV